jgi:hypothetical protein
VNINDIAVLFTASEAGASALGNWNHKIAPISPKTANAIFNILCIILRI